jgi:integrase
MARVFKRKQKSWTTYFIEYYHEGTQYREKVGRSKDGITESMAKEALKSREGDIVKDKFDLAKTKTHPLFSKVMQEYLEHSKADKKPNSYRRDLISSKHLLDYFGNKRIDAIDLWIVKKYQKKRKEEIIARYPDKDERDISFASINREIALLRHFYSMAIESGKIDNNPFTVGKKITMFQEKPKERYLTENEVIAFLGVCDRSDNRFLKVIVLTALHTGTRLQETLNIKVEDVDFRNSLIYLPYTKNGDRGKVVISDLLESVLKEHIGERESGYLFYSKDGQPFKNVRTSMQTAYKRAGIEGCSFHTLRHTFASHLTMSGVDSFTVQDLGRWKTEKMVKRYAHLSPNYKRKAVNRLTFGTKDKHEISTPIKTRLEATP